MGKDGGEGYNLFKVLSHPTRAKIIELLHENIELSYTEMLNTLKTDTGQLNFHLRNIKGLCEITGDGTYILTDKGKITYNLIKEVKKLSGEQEVIIDPQASILKRFVATAIDFIIFISMPMLSAVFLIYHIPILRQGINIIELIGYMHALLSLSLLILVLMETYNGQTLGKYIIGIRVLKENDRKLNVVESALRNIAKLFFLPLDLLVGCLFFKKKGYLRFSDYYTRAKVIDLGSTGVG